MSFYNVNFDPPCSPKVVGGGELGDEVGEGERGADEEGREGERGAVEEGREGERGGEGGVMM